MGPAAAGSCQELSKPISIDQDGETIAFVGPQPLSIDPLPVELFKGIPAFVPGPYYLDYVGWDPCLYQVHSTKGDADFFSRGKISSPEMFGMPTSFGLPTL